MNSAVLFVHVSQKQFLRQLLLRQSAYENRKPSLPIITECITVEIMPRQDHIHMTNACMSTPKLIHEAHLNLGNELNLSLRELYFDLVVIAVHAKSLRYLFTIR